MTRREPSFVKFLNSSPIVLLDGAIGTELERRGYNSALPLWTATACLDEPELLASIHRDYIIAGADIVTANTFRTTRYTMKKAGSDIPAEKITAESIRIARKATANTPRQVWVAASIAPLEDCYSPELVPEDHTIFAEYHHQVEAIVEAAPDLILAETMINIAEIRILGEILAETGLPFMFSFTANKTGNLLDGTPFDHVLDLVAGYDPEAILLNCREPGVITSLIARFNRDRVRINGAYANGRGVPGGDTGWMWDRGEDYLASYSTHARKWINAGCSIIGGCCGTDPDLIRALDRLRSEVLPGL